MSLDGASMACEMLQKPLFLQWKSCRGPYRGRPRWASMEPLCRVDLLLAPWVSWSLCWTHARMSGKQFFQKCLTCAFSLILSLCRHRGFLEVSVTPVMRVTASHMLEKTFSSLGVVAHRTLAQAWPELPAAAYRSLQEWWRTKLQTGVLVRQPSRTWTPLLNQ